MEKPGIPSRMCHAAASLVLAAWVLGPLVGLVAAEVHVSAKGSDQGGDGSRGNPWATVGRALARTNGATIITIGPGTFDMGTVTVRSDLVMRGAGPTATVLVGTIKAGETKGRPVQRLQLSGFALKGTLAGDPLKRPMRGIDLLNISDTQIAQVHIEGFKQTGLRIRRVTRTLVDDCVFRKCTFNPKHPDNPYPASEDTFDRKHPEVGGSEGSAVWVGDCRDVVLRRLDIDTREFGGRGIGNTHSPSPDGDFDFTPNTMENLEIGHCTIMVDQWHGWHVKGGSHHPPQFTIELCGWRGDRVRVHHSLFNQGFSMVPGTKQEDFKPTSMRLDHNRFALIPTGPKAYSYVLETTVPHLEFDHNHVLNGTTSISNFAGSGLVVPGMRIHHNLWEGLSFKALLHIGSQAPGLHFVNNTVVFTSKQHDWVPVIIAGDDATPGKEVKQGPDQVVMNNLFCSTVDNSGLRLGFSAGMKHNLFWRLKPDGDEAATADPRLVAAAGPEWPRYIPAPGSPAIGAARVLAPYSDGSVGTPDLGYWEQGTPFWDVGPNRDLVDEPVLKRPVVQPAATTEQKVKPVRSRVVVDDATAATWDRRLFTRVREELAKPRRSLEFTYAALRQKVELESTEADGGLGLRLGEAHMQVAWKQLGTSDHLSLAMALLREGVPGDHALLAFQLLRDGRIAEADPHLARAGDDAAALRTLVPSNNGITP